MILWRVSDGKFKTEYIRANSFDEAKTIFESRNFNPAIEIRPTEGKIQAVYFSDNPCHPAYFKGNKTEARKGAKLYIRQWGLDATIDRIETL